MGQDLLDRQYCQICTGIRHSFEELRGVTFFRPPESLPRYANVCMYVFETCIDNINEFLLSMNLYDARERIFV